MPLGSIPQPGQTHFHARPKAAAETVYIRARWKHLPSWEWTAWETGRGMLRNEDAPREGWTVTSLDGYIQAFKLSKARASIVDFKCRV